MWKGCEFKLWKGHVAELPGRIVTGAPIVLVVTIIRSDAKNNDK